MPSVSTIVVCDYAAARAALAAAATGAVCLRVPFAVMAAVGPAVAQAMIERALADHQRGVTAGLRVGPPLWEADCGDTAGLALQALRLGVPQIRTAAGADVAAKLADIGRHRGAVVISYNYEEEASLSGSAAGPPDLGWASIRWRERAVAGGAEGRRTAREKRRHSEPRCQAPGQSPRQD